VSVKWITGDVFDGLAQLDDASVDLVVTGWVRCCGRQE